MIPKSITKGEKDIKKRTARTTMFNQGLGQPRMTAVERICDMMMQLDEHSDKIPEGMYLQFCEHLKVFHQNIEKNLKYRQKLAAQETELIAREAELFSRSRGSRRCGCCREIGHDRRNCPQVQ
jgi:hypothetical protein